MTPPKDYEVLKQFNWWKFFAIISWILLVIVVYLWLFLPDIEAQEISWHKFSDIQIVQAIYKAENSVKYPYGIKSINTHGNKEYARKICLQSVVNGRARWIKAGRPLDLITCIGLRYSPPKENPNWVKLVRYFLNENSKGISYKN